MDGEVAVQEKSAISEDFGRSSGVRSLVPWHEAVELICSEVGAHYRHTGLITTAKLRYVTLQFEGLEKQAVVQLHNNGKGWLTGNID